MKKITVDNSENIRLDRYIRRIFPNATQGLIERSLRSGNVKVNHSKIKSGYRLQRGDEIILFGDLFQTHVAQAQSFSKNAQSLAKKLLNDYLIIATDEFIAIDKPANMAVQGGTNIKLSIDEALGYLNVENGSDFKLVHRLDKATSGILLIACGAQNAAKLAEAFQSKLIQKTYLAIVCGRPVESEGVIVNYIGKDRSGIFEIVKELPEGKRAETKYRLIKEIEDKALIEFKPATGRMHQLRVHSKILGCLILGDEKYGGVPYRRMMLHAQKLTIPQEIFGREIVIEAKLPSDWLDF